MYQNPAESAIFVAFSDVQNLTKSDPRFSHPDARLFSANDITYTVEVSDDMQTVDALNAAINAFSPTLIEDRIDYWSFHLGPKFSSKERKGSAKEKAEDKFHVLSSNAGHHANLTSIRRQLGDSQLTWSELA